MMRGCGLDGCGRSLCERGRGQRGRRLRAAAPTVSSGWERWRKRASQHQLICDPGEREREE